MRLITNNHDGSPASSVNLGMRKATAVFEGETQDELRTPEVGHAAIQYAHEKGLIGAAIRTEGFVYAVTADGKPTDLLQPLPTGGKFRIEIELGSTL